jgi:hypothetical protein
VEVFLEQYLGCADVAKPTFIDRENDVSRPMSNLLLSTELEYAIFWCRKAKPAMTKHFVSSTTKLHLARRWISYREAFAGLSPRRDD